MQQTVYKCDECGRVKQESNHWFCISYQADMVGCMVLSRFYTTGSPTLVHICSQECLVARVSKWAGALVSAKETT
jgi:hypothetical protein